MILGGIDIGINNEAAMRARVFLSLPRRFVYEAAIRTSLRAIRG